MHCIFVCRNAVKSSRLQFLLFPFFRLKMVLYFSGIFFTSRLLLVMTLLLGKTLRVISFSTILTRFFYAACGHVCCFWCIHKSMSGVSDSSCAFCRSSYSHFPSICQTFHFLIWKMYPVSYKRREEQVFGKLDYFVYVR